MSTVEEITQDFESRREAGKAYIPQHTPEEYLAFIRECGREFHFRELDPHHGARRVYSLFTIESQHVPGDSLEEVLDQAMIMAAGLKKFGRPGLRFWSQPLA